jgi:hypothetical protein
MSSITLDQIEQKFINVLTQDANCNFRIEPQTIVVTHNGLSLEDFFYYYPGQPKQLLDARQSTWRYIDVHQLEIGQCVTFICEAHYKIGYMPNERYQKVTKRPLFIWESRHIKTLSDALDQSNEWHNFFARKTQEQVISAILSYDYK